MTAFSAALDALYANPNFGEAATYTPPAGSPVAVTIVWTRPDESVSLGGMATRLPKRIARVRSSQIAGPQKNATLAIGAATYTIAGAERDELGLEWSLDLKG